MTGEWLSRADSSTHWRIQIPQFPNKFKSSCKEGVISPWNIYSKSCSQQITPDHPFQGIRKKKRSHRTLRKESSHVISCEPPAFHPVNCMDGKACLLLEVSNSNDAIWCCADVLCFGLYPKIGRKACLEPWRFRSEESDEDKVKSRMAGTYQ